MKSVLRWVWRGLRTPTNRRPEDYRDSRLAHTVNAVLDGPMHGWARHNRVGESVAMAADQVLHTRFGPTPANSPLGNLLLAVSAYIADTAKDRLHEPKRPKRRLVRDGRHEPARLLNSQRR
jgi:hypothetical protein